MFLVQRIAKLSQFVFPLPTKIVKKKFGRTLERDTIFSLIAELQKRYPSFFGKGSGPLQNSSG